LHRQPTRCTGVVTLKPLSYRQTASAKGLDYENVVETTSGALLLKSACVSTRRLLGRGSSNCKEYQQSSKVLEVVIESLISDHNFLSTAEVWIECCGNTLHGIIICTYADALNGFASCCSAFIIIGFWIADECAVLVT